MCNTTTSIDFTKRKKSDMEQWMPMILCVLLLMVERVYSHGDHGATYTYVTNNHTAVDIYLNKCLAGINHKDHPSAETALYHQCDQWKERSCCKPDVTQGLHANPTWYNFDWNHCSRGLSHACKDWLRKDLCFYECSPNVGPWLVQHRISIRDERFVNVPLCRSECNLWFDACRNDYTCKDNWATGWNWTTHTNTCPEGSQCRTFEETFKTAENMCENLWDGSFNVTEDDTDCMVLWFTGSNPNDKVATQRAIELVDGSGGHKFSGNEWVIFTLSILMIFTTCLFT